MANFSTYDPSNPYNGIAFYWFVLPILVLSIPLKLWLLAAANNDLPRALLLISGLTALMSFSSGNYLFVSIGTFVFLSSSIYAAIDAMAVNKKTKEEIPNENKIT